MDAVVLDALPLDFESDADASAAERDANVVDAWVQDDDAQRFAVPQAQDSGDAAAMAAVVAPRLPLAPEGPAPGAPPQAGLGAVGILGPLRVDRRDKYVLFGDVSEDAVRTATERFIEFNFRSYFESRLGPVFEIVRIV